MGDKNLPDDSEAIHIGAYWFPRSRRNYVCGEVDYCIDIRNSLLIIVRCRESRPRAPKIADTFLRKESGCNDTTQAARALHCAVTKLCSEKCFVRTLGSIHPFGEMNLALENRRL